MTSSRPSDTGLPTDPPEPDHDSHHDAEPDRESAGAKRSLIALGVLVVLGAAVWGGSALFAKDEPVDEDPLPAATGLPLTPWRPSDPAQAPAGRPNPEAGERPVVLFDGPLTIDSGLGIDVDRIQSADSPGQSSGAAEPAAQDVFWAQNAGLSVNDGRLFIDQGLPGDAAQRCAARVAGGRDGYPSLDVFPGDQFCLRTSEGRIAWLRIGEGADKDDELAVQVTVWDGLPG